MFFRIQEEIARRNSKKPANTKKSKTNRGRFTSKYALSERLVCGDCGCYFRRVTWNIHGRKQIVWRCINRLEFGPKSCGNSPSLEESTLYNAIMAAIRSLVHGQQEEMTAALQDTFCYRWFSVLAFLVEKNDDLWYNQFKNSPISIWKIQII